MFDSYIRSVQYVTPHLPSGVPEWHEKFRNMLSGALEMDPSQRKTATQLLKVDIILELEDQKFEAAKQRLDMLKLEKSRLQKLLNIE